MNACLAPLAVLLMTGVLSGACFGAEPLSDETLDRTTAQGPREESREPAPVPSRSTVPDRTAGAILTIHPHAQTHLRSGAVNNTAGSNQIANGINLR